MFCMHDLHACCKAQNPLEYPGNAIAVHVVPWLPENVLTPQHSNFNESLVPALLGSEIIGYALRTAWTRPSGRCQDTATRGWQRLRCHCKNQDSRFKGAGSLVWNKRFMLQLVMTLMEDEKGFDDIDNTLQLMLTSFVMFRCELNRSWPSFIRIGQNNWVTVLFFTGSCWDLGVSSQCHHLRVHNVVLYLWVISPRCASDASMVMETTMRSLEYAMKLCKEKGVVCPDQLMVWEPWSDMFTAFLVLKVKCFAGN